jgi:ammonia channel protein AmtB
MKLLFVSLLVLASASCSAAAKFKAGQCFNAGSTVVEIREVKEKGYLIVEHTIISEFSAFLAHSFVENVIAKKGLLPVTCKGLIK